MHKLMKMIGVLGAVSSGCLSQEIGLVSAEIDGWAYLPIMIGQDVDLIIAMRLETSSSPIKALWCWEDANGDWQADAWENVAWEDVAAFTFDYIGYEAGDVEVEDDLFLWPVEMDVSIVNQALDSLVQPQPFGDGVFFEDALEPLVQSDPEILEPLEAIGYPAVATMSGISITQGTFGGVGIDPQPKGDECIALVDLLGALALAFELSDTDWDTIDQVFIADYGASMAPGCSCPTRDWVVSAAATWADTCRAWVQTSGPHPEGPSCRYGFERAVSSSRTRIRARTEWHPLGYCVSEVCNQTQFRTTIQNGSSITWRGYNEPPCPAAGPAPATPCTGGGTPGPWVPALCPWEI